MYDIDLKYVKKGRGFYFIFLGAGLFFLAILLGVFIYNVVRIKSFDANTLSKSVEINSYVDDEGSTMYRPVYTYVVGGQQYTCSASFSSSSYPSEDNKIVYYDSKNPANCMSEASTSFNFIILIFLLIPAIFILIGALNIRNVNKRIKLIKELNKTGKLVKNLPYRLEPTGMEVNGVPILRPVVDYVLPSGSTIVLFGDPRHDGKRFDADGMVDLLIDEKNPNNYFIDFEINRLTGNLPQDYYVQNTQMNNINSNLQDQSNISYNYPNQNNM